MRLFEPIVAEDLWDRVQARLGSGSTPRVEKKLTLMHRKALCEECGGTISWYEKKGHWYSECKSNKPCTVRGCARQDKIEEELADYFAELIAPSPAIIGWVKKELGRSHASEAERYQASIGKLQSSLRRLDLQIKILYEDRLDGRISPEIYDQKFKEKTAERKSITKNIERISDENIGYIEQAIDILDLTQNAAEIFRTKPIEDQRILLGDVFSAITLNGKCMKVVWRPETEVIRNAVEKTKRLEKILEPSSGLSNMELSEASRSIWLPRLDSNQRPID